MKNAFFIGIGGMGMSGLAKILHEGGSKVAGSDRNPQGEYCCRLRELGVKIYPQDGTGPESFMKDASLGVGDFRIVKSTAVEDIVPDVVSAKRLGIEQIMRSDLLAELFNAKKGIAVGGTAGKTTTSGLISWILKKADFQPSCAVGGIISGLDTNAFEGKGENFVIEADESDGSIVKYKPYISLVTNISRDHKPLEELKELFGTFLENTAKEGIRLVCGDDPNALSLKEACSAPVKTYGFSQGCDFQGENIHSESECVKFTFRGTEFTANMPGEHNALNALAAAAVCVSCGMNPETAADCLKAFPGMKRRFEKAGEKGGVLVIDDFAHNPAEIEAALNSARKHGGCIYAVYQPHGFGPTGFTRNELVKVFSSMKPAAETLYLDEIYYGGGTVDKNISSSDIYQAVKPAFPNIFCPGTREAIASEIASKAKPGDIVLVMGARDVNKICQMVLQAL